MTFKYSRSGYKDLLNSQMMHTEMARRARRVADKANDYAPVQSGDLSRSHTGRSETTDRAVGRVGSNVPYAAAVNANTGYLEQALLEGADG